MKEFVKKLLKSSSFGKLIYPAVQWCYKSWHVPYKRRLLQKHGYGFLEKIDRICTENSIKYFCDWGTLLGIVRDNGFIKHDDDIDLTVYQTSEDPRRVLKVFIDAGFEMIHALKRGDELVEFSLEYKGLSVDFFFFEKCNEAGRVRMSDVYFNPEVKYPNSAMNSVRYWKFPDNLEAVDHDFNGVHCMIPKNCEEVLAWEYGATWRTPIAKWQPTDAPGWTNSSDLIERVLDVDEVLSK